MEYLSVFSCTEDQEAAKIYFSEHTIEDFLLQVTGLKFDADILRFLTCDKMCVVWPWELKSNKRMSYEEIMQMPEELRAAKIIDIRKVQKSIKGSDKPIIILNFITDVNFCVGFAKDLFILEDI